MVWVSDTGIGIAPEIHPKLFSKFFRADSTATRSIGGTGLGLALVKNLVTAHGGRIWVESVPDKGSTFFFTLPVEDESLVRTHPSQEVDKEQRNSRGTIPLSV